MVKLVVYGKEKLFTDEKELDEFMKFLTWHWEEGYTAKQIAEEMGFGKPEGYPKLKVYHVYYFIKKHGYEWEGVEPRKKWKKKVKVEEEQVQQKIPFTNDMPFEVARYLRSQGLLIE